MLTPFQLIKKISDPIWEVPLLYKLLQAVLAGGGHSVIKKFLLKEIPKSSKKILDQGCGTGEYSLLFKEKYTGLDNNKDYIKDATKKYAGKFILGDASKMKLKNNNFDVVFAVGLHHHLPDNLARKAFYEAIRVCKKGGKVIIIDAMLPKNPLNFIGFFLRKIDRGGHVRKKENTLKLIPKEFNYKPRVISSFPFDYITIIFEKTKA